MVVRKTFFMLKYQTSKGIIFIFFLIHSPIIFFERCFDSAQHDKVRKNAKAGSLSPGAMQSGEIFELDHSIW